MKTNDLKKGVMVELSGHVVGILQDNKKGVRRTLEVLNKMIKWTESFYTHDIIAYYDAAGHRKTDIEFTKEQNALRETVKAFDNRFVYSQEA